MFKDFQAFFDQFILFLLTNNSLLDPTFYDANYPLHQVTPLVNLIGLISGNNALEHQLGEVLLELRQTDFIYGCFDIVADA